MTEDQNINLVFAIGALVLVAGALFSRRIGLGEIIRNILAWVAIFALFIVGFSYQREILAVWGRVTGEMTGGNEQAVVGDTLRIRQSADGHFWVDAKDLPVVVAEEFGDSNVIGMNFLSSLRSWRVEGTEMVLEPPAGAPAG